MRCSHCQADNPEETRFNGRCGAEIAAPTDPAAASTRIMDEPLLGGLAAGQVFAGRYQVIEDLGRGGMGRVCKVNDAEVREDLVRLVLRRLDKAPEKRPAGASRRASSRGLAAGPPSGPSEGRLSSLA
jgi:hypothetical protein